MADDTGTIETTVGQLTASDLGATVTIDDGGSTHRGALAKAEHMLGYDNDQTFIVLRSGDWRHIKAYPSDTPCLIAAHVEGGKP